MYILLFILSFIPYIVFLNLTLFYLDDFHLSENKYIRYSQILSPLLTVFLILIYYNSISNGVLFLNDNKNTNISLGANVEIGKDAAFELSKGINSAGSNIGLAGTVGAVTTGVAKVVSKSSIPPLQKAAVVGSAFMGGLIHAGATHINRSDALE